MRLVVSAAESGAAARRIRWLLDVLGVVLVAPPMIVATTHTDAGHDVRTIDLADEFTRVVSLRGGLFSVQARGSYRRAPAAFGAPLAADSNARRRFDPCLLPFLQRAGATAP